MSLYRVLGVAKTASKQQIKLAYRKMAMQFHPDKHTHSDKQKRDAATERFKRLSAAYETLIDDRRRASYDLINPDETAARRRQYQRQTTDHQSQNPNHETEARQRQSRPYQNPNYEASKPRQRQQNHHGGGGSAIVREFRRFCLEFVVPLFVRLLFRLIGCLVSALFEASKRRKG